MTLSVCNRKDKNNQKHFQENFFNWGKKIKQTKQKTWNATILLRVSKTIGEMKVKLTELKKKKWADKELLV